MTHSDNKRSRGGALPALSGLRGLAVVRVGWPFARARGAPLPPRAPLGLPCLGLAVVGRSKMRCSGASARHCAPHSGRPAWIEMRGWCRAASVVVSLLALCWAAQVATTRYCGSAADKHKTMVEKSGENRTADTALPLRGRACLRPDTRRAGIFGTCFGAQNTAHGERNFSFASCTCVKNSFRSVFYLIRKTKFSNEIKKRSGQKTAPMV